MIQIEDLYKSYDHQAVLQDVNLTFRENVITGLLGPNGAGKTTLVSILIGIITKDQGHVLINGLDLDGNQSKIKAISSIVPQGFAFYPTLSAYENLEYFGALYGLEGKTLKSRIDMAVDIASLQSFIYKRVHKFSGGMKRRLNLAIGLLNLPQILYLDEPTVGVDPQSRNYILDMIRKINGEKKTTMIYTSHYMDEIEQISDDIAIIDEGKIVLHDRKENILTHAKDATVTVESIPGPVAAELASREGVEVVGNRIFIGKNENFNINLSRVFTILETERIRVTEMASGYRSLEKIFLKLTSERLRDNE